MWFAPSAGFFELVSRTHDPAQGLTDLSGPVPTSKEELWDAFLFPLFIGRDRNGRQAAYAEKVLRDHLSFEQARLARTDANWRMELLAKVDLTISRLGTTARAGSKRKILEDVRVEVVGPSFANTLAGMSGFVDSFDSKLVSDMRGDFDREYRFVVESLDSDVTPGVSYTKFVLWLQSVNSAWTLTPPSGPVRWALDSRDLGFTGTNPYRWGEDAGEQEIVNEDRVKFGTFCTCYRNLCSELAPKVGPNLTPMETQTAAWIFGSTHGLLPPRSRAANRLSCEALLEYVDSQGLTLRQYVQRVLDIDRAGAIERDLVGRL